MTQICVMYVEKTLCSVGYAAAAALDGEKAYGKFCEERFDLVILMLTALETIEDKEKGFNSGAEDYLV